MRRFVGLLLLVAACRPAPPPDATPPFPGGTIIDLTHPFDAETVYWPTASGFEMSVDFKGPTPGGWWYEANTITTAEHGGTHLDAPVHFAEGMHAADQVPLDRLIGPAVMIDVSEACAADPDYQVTAADLASWEASHGTIPDGAILLVNTGFARFWPDREAYMGTAERGPDAVARLRFPGLQPDAARWLVENRSISAIGIDTPSIDRGQSPDFMTHQVLFAANIPAFENVASMEALPATGFSVIAMPMKIAGGSGGPLRIAAILP